MDQGVGDLSESVNAIDCLVGKFGNFRSLTEAELLFLGSLQGDEKSLSAGREIIVQGGASENLYVLKSGYAYSYKLLSNGKRQVLEFRLTGDFLGIREFAFDMALAYVVLSSDAAICPFPKSRISDLFEQLPGLAAILFQIGTREQAVLVERIVNLGSRSAYQRVAHLILELWERILAVGLIEGKTFDLPYSQVVLADALGLSTVHTSRTLKKLRQNGLVAIRNRRATIEDLERLIAAAGFEEFYFARESLSRYL